MTGSKPIRLFVFAPHDYHPVAERRGLMVPAGL
jgi:hypothetical protein